MTDPGSMPRAAALARIHGALNIMGGLWPLASMSTFEAVMGPKVDRWLVRTVAGLLVANGTTQVRAAGSAEGRRRARDIGIGTAATLAAIDLWYAPRRRISLLYLADAALELALVAAWVAVSRSDEMATTAPEAAMAATAA